MPRLRGRPGWMWLLPPWSWRRPPGRDSCSGWRGKETASMRKMKQPIRRDPARWMEGHVPPGLDWRAECRWAAVGLILGALWSAIVFLYRLDGALDLLYE